MAVDDYVLIGVCWLLMYDFVVVVCCVLRVACCSLVVFDCFVLCVRWRLWF